MKYRIKTIMLSALLTFSTGQSVASPLQDTLWQHVSTEYRLPAYLLYAIAYKESRHTWPDGLVRPWPWTVNVAGTATYHANKEEALASIHAALDSGITNIDIGMMQINFHHNGHRADSIEALIEPEINVRVAAQVLTEAMSRSDDLSIGIGTYFNSDEKIAQDYGRKVLMLLGQLYVALEKE